MKVLIGAAAVAFALGIGVAVAGDACCGTCKADAPTCSVATMSNLVVKLSLTDDQAAKVKDICAKYCQGEQTAAAMSKCSEEVEKLLTPDQAAKFKGMSECKTCPAVKPEEPKKTE